jgi:uncharacterized membrane protein
VATTLCSMEGWTLSSLVLSECHCIKFEGSLVVVYMPFSASCLCESCCFCVYGSPLWVELDA